MGMNARLHYAAIEVSSGWCQFHSLVVAVVPLREKRVRQDDVIKRVSIKPHVVENNVEKKKEIIHFFLFHLVIYFIN